MRSVTRGEFERLSSLEALWAAWHNYRRGQLVEAREAIRAWLQSERKLSLKTRRDGVLPTGQPGTFLGFRVSRAGVSPGPKAKRRLKRRLRAAESLGLDRLERSLQAYRGMMLSL